MRSYKWDNVKAGLMLLVIIGHFAANFTGDNEFARSIFMFIYIFHMPAFMFVSGLFAKTIVDADKLDLRRIIPYLILAFFLSVLRAITPAALGMEEFSYSMLNIGSAAWYLYALFIFYVIAHGIRNVDVRYVIIISLICSILIGYDTKTDSWMAILRLMYYFPFFYVGYIIDYAELEERLGKLGAKIGGAVILVLAGFISIRWIDDIYPFRRLITGGKSYFSLPASVDVPIYAGVWRIISLIITIIMSLAFFAVIPGKKIPFISENTGRRTLSVYFWHQILVDALSSQGWFEDFIYGRKLKMLIGFVIPAIIILMLFSLEIFYKPLNLVLDVPERKR